MILTTPYAASSCRSNSSPNSTIASTVPSESAPARFSPSCLATTPIARILRERECPPPCVLTCGLTFGNHRRLPHFWQVASPKSSKGSMDTSARQTGQRLSRPVDPPDETITIALSTSGKHSFDTILFYHHRLAVVLRRGPERRAGLSSRRGSESVSGGNWAGYLAGAAGRTGSPAARGGNTQSAAQAARRSPARERRARKSRDARIS
jgi:hypothetical protein